MDLEIHLRFLEKLVDINEGADMIMVKPECFFGFNQ